MMGIDDRGEGRIVRILADIGVMGPDELITGYSLAGIRHPGEAEIGGVGKNGRQQRAFVRAHLPGAKILECRNEPSFSGNLME